MPVQMTEVQNLDNFAVDHKWTFIFGKLPTGLEGKLPKVESFNLHVENVTLPQKMIMNLVKTLHGHTVEQPSTQEYNRTMSFTIAETEDNFGVNFIRAWLEAVVQRDTGVGAKKKAVAINTCILQLETIENKPRYKYTFRGLSIKTPTEGDQLGNGEGGGAFINQTIECSFDDFLGEEVKA